MVSVDWCPGVLRRQPAQPSEHSEDELRKSKSRMLNGEDGDLGTNSGYFSRLTRLLQPSCGSGNGLADQYTVVGGAGMPHVALRKCYRKSSACRVQVEGKGASSPAGRREELVARWQ